MKTNLIEYEKRLAIEITEKQCLAQMRNDTKK